MFFKCYFSNVNVFIFSYFESHFIEKFLWESGFSNFDQNRNDAKGPTFSIFFAEL